MPDTVQYTIRGVPEDVDARLRAEARASGRSLNGLVVERLTVSSLPRTPPHDDLDWFIGSADATFADEQEAAAAWLDSLPREL